MCVFESPWKGKTVMVPGVVFPCYMLHCFVFVTDTNATSTVGQIVGWEGNWGERKTSAVVFRSPQFAARPTICPWVSEDAMKQAQESFFHSETGSTHSIARLMVNGQMASVGWLVLWLFRDTSSTPTPSQSLPSPLPPTPRPPTIAFMLSDVCYPWGMCCSSMSCYP